MSEVKRELRYGENIEWFLNELAAENVALMGRIDWPMEQCPTTGAVTAVDPADFIPVTVAEIATKESKHE